MVGERFKKLTQEEPLIRRLSNKYKGPGHRIRDKQDQRIEDVVPSFKERNFGGGRGVGILGAAIGTALEDVIGVPFGGSSSVVAIEEESDGVVYTVDVNSPFETMAEARAAIDSSTGYTSFVTEEMDTMEVDVLKTRVFRDTYRVELKIKDE